MSRDIYNPTVYVGDMEIKSWSSINFKDKGKNQEEREYTVENNRKQTLPDYHQGLKVQT